MGNLEHQQEQWKKNGRLSKMLLLAQQRSYVAECLEKGIPIKKENQTRWMEEVAKAIGEKRHVWKMIEVIKENGEHIFTDRQKKKAARRAVDKAKREMEEELYRKLDEERRLIYKLAGERGEDSKDVKTGSVLKDKKDREYVLQIWEEYLKELLNHRENGKLELPSAVEEK